MHKLLIADPSEPFSEALEAVLKNEFDLQICHDGDSALEALLTFQPDILILNFMLPFKDGLTLLQQSAHRPRIILAIAPYVSPYIEQSAAALGVQYIMIMPTVSTLRVRLMDILTSTCSPAGDLSAQTLLLLHTLNFPTHLDGYRHLCVGIPIFAENPDMRLSKELYPAIAAHFGSPDPRTVEHSIRKAIASAWASRDPRIWVKYFPPNADGTVDCPSNKAFISRLSAMLKL